MDEATLQDLIKNYTEYIDEKVKESIGSLHCNYKHKLLSKMETIIF